MAVAASVEGASRAAAARWIRDGRVSVDGRPADRPGAKLSPGAILRIETPEPAPAQAVAQDLPLSIVYEDDDIAIIDKATGMVVHPAAGHPDGTLVNALLHHFDGLSTIGGVERPGLVHRLDAGTSGLLVVAKNDHAHKDLSQQFAEHSAGRTYLALVHDPPDAPSGTIESSLSRDPHHRQRFASLPAGQEDRGKRAVTHWERLAVRGTVGLLRCRLQTGRTHQVRVHLSEYGSPLLGDDLYARRGSSPLPRRLLGLVERPMLHAWCLSLRHPRTGLPIAEVAPPPADFAALLAALEIALPERP